MFHIHLRHSTGGRRLLPLAAVLLLLSTPGDAREIADDPMGICPVPIGSAMPEVLVRTMDGTELMLGELLHGHPTALLIYRGGWCPYCNAHLSEMATIEADLFNLGFQVIAVSPDTPPHLVITDAQDNPGYTLLSNSAMDLAVELGIAFRVDEETLERYEGYGIDLEEASGEDHHLLPVPAALLVDADGIIRFFYVNPDYKARIDVGVFLAAAKAEKRRQ
jgi:peroxiredoxin